MSDYPPVPQFGTAYPPILYDAPAAETYNSGMSQHPYQPRMQSSYTDAHPQTLSHAMTPTPHANAYSFRANGQGTGQAVNEINGASSGYYDREYPATASTHPPTHAQNPFPGSYFSQSSNLLPANPTISQTHIQPPLEPSNHLPYLNKQNPQQEGARSSTHSESELEDGEVDDQENSKLSNASGVNEMGDIFSRPSHQGGNEGVNPTSKTSNSKHHTSEPPPHQSLQIPLSEGNFNVSEHDLTPQSPKRTYHTSLPANGSKGEYSPTDAHLPALKVEEAQQALLDLHSHGLDFNHIVNYGMNADILRSMYAKLRIPIASSPSSQLQQAANPAASVAGRNTHERDQSQGPHRTSSTRNNTQLLKKDHDIVKGSSSSTQAVEEEKKSIMDPATTAAPKKTTNGISLVKPSVVKATDPKSLDRKEYIARMLAAKAGKPAIPAKPFVPSRLAMGTTPDVADQPVPSSAIATPSKPATVSTNQESDHQSQGEASVALPHPVKHGADAEAKRRAQTDLARQKMEALKLQQGTHKANNSIPTHQDSSTLSRDPPQAPMVAPITVPRPPASSRQNSYFSPISQQAPFSIPGLFMTEGPSHSHSIHSTVEHSSPAVAAPGLRPNELSQHPLPSWAAAAIKEPNAEAKNITGSNGLATTGSVHRKRQKAADFLDSPATKMQRPLGQQEDSGVIIDISDEEMVDASDADSMDVDVIENRPNASKKFQSNQFADGRQKTLQDYPPLNDLTPRRKTPARTPPLSQMPNQAKGLKTKEMEIESMNRKIAELEQRINAKKTISRAQTPGPLGSAVGSPPSQPSLNGGKLLQDTKDITAETKGPISDGLSGQLPSIAMEKADTIEAERNLHEVEKAKAEAERSLAAGTAKSLDRNLEHEQGETVTLSKEKVSAFREEGQRSEGSPSQNVEHRVEHREMPEEQRFRASNEESDVRSEDLPSRESQEGRALVVELARSQEADQFEVADEQRRQRQLAIESGLPLLDATVEKTKQRLQYLRKEVEELELEVQKGIEGRKALVEELSSLSAAPKQRFSSEEQSSQAIGKHSEQLLTENATKGKCYS